MMNWLYRIACAIATVALLFVMLMGALDFMEPPVVDQTILIPPITEQPHVRQ